MEIQKNDKKELQENILNYIEKISLNEFTILFSKLDDICIQKIVTSQQIHSVQKSYYLYF